MKRVLVVLPSYNESENIVSMVDSLLGLSAKKIDVGVCVVDDNSPDGTPGILATHKAENAEWEERVTVIIRDKKDGRGGAVRDGLEHGLSSEHAFDYFVEMDCDFSHPPASVLEGVVKLESGFDVVLGSRYPDGVIEGWPLSRRVLSFFANQLARVLLSRHIFDYTNGFRFYTRKMVELLVQHEQRNKGYIYLSETLSLFIKNEAAIGEFPIHFVNRERGESNTSVQEIMSALKGIVDIGIRHRKGQ